MTFALPKSARLSRVLITVTIPSSVWMTETVLKLREAWRHGSANQWRGALKVLLMKSTTTDCSGLHFSASVMTTRKGIVLQEASQLMILKKPKSNLANVLLPKNRAWGNSLA